MLFEHDDAIRSATRRARVVEVNDKGSQQRVDLRGLKNEKPKKIWRTMDFGYTSVPPKDSDGIIDQMGSRSDRTTYRDGGHEKYRPKRTPDGCSALYNMHGDIIRVFKDSSDVVHQKKINIRVGKGYKAGVGGDGSGSETGIDDESGEDTKTISIVMEDGQAITLEYEGSTVTIREDGHIVCQAASQFSGGVDGGKWVVVRAARVDLGVSGPDGTATPAVVTDAGPSTKVFAEV